MSQRRMFSPDIVESEEFITMPISSQALYFHLGMAADDDGFVQPKLIMRTLGNNDDDLKVLLAKRFLLSFNTGVVVIKHWLIHNMIRGDRYKPTRFQDEKQQLLIKENKSYTELNKLGCQNDNQMAAQVRLSKVSIGKDKLDKDTNTCAKAPEKEKSSPECVEIIKAFEVIDAKNKTYYGNKTQRKACEFLIKEYGMEQVMKVIKILPQTNKIDYMPTIYTPYDLKEKYEKLKAQLQKYENNRPLMI